MKPIACLHSDPCVAGLRWMTRMKRRSHGSERSTRRVSAEQPKAETADRGAQPRARGAPLASDWWPQRRIRSVTSQPRQASVTDTPGWSLERSVGID